MSRHIKNLNIVSFRGIQNLILDNLGDINILVGDNNCGKTSVLEAILLLRNPSDFSNVVNLSRMREQYKLSSGGRMSFYDSFIYMFNKISKEMKISVSADICNSKVSLDIQGQTERMLVDIEELKKQSRIIRNKVGEDFTPETEEVEAFKGELTYFIESNQVTVFKAKPVTIPINYNKYIENIGISNKPYFISTKFISTIEHIIENNFRNIIRDDKVTNDVVEILKIFDKDIINLKIIEDDGGRFIQIVEHKILGAMPLSVYGDGMKKVITLANGIVAAKDGILLIDEVETSIHKGGTKSVFSWLVLACKRFNVQLFLTTHSLEAVDQILNSNKTIIEEDMTRVITLIKKSDKTVARILTGEKALQARDDYDMELRS